MTDFFTLSIEGASVESFLPLAIIIIPIVGSLLIGLTGFKSVLFRNILAVVVVAVTLYFSYELFMLKAMGYTVFYDLPPLAGVTISLRPDLVGTVFTLFSALVWFLATLASLSYMQHEERQTRYYTFLVLTLGGCLGVFLSGDFLSLFLFFELMTLAAYALVVHTQKDEAMAAGANYLYLGVIGGLSLLSGIILLNKMSGSVMIAARLQDFFAFEGLAIIIALLMIAGFGVKAGMIPLHIWLPQAHPVAPSPASALLSGIMIKTGAYGIIRVVAMLFTPAESLAESADWSFTTNLGHFIIWMGILTMLLAALMAMLQNNAKRLLAYSSISQMGYILMGIGAAGYLGFDGPMAFGGFSYHIINHAFFKSGFFILFGIIYARLHEIRMDRLGGLWRKFPVTFAAFAVCAAGITGIPGFNGYVSKTLLHHAIVEAFEHHHLWDLWLAEKLFMLTSALTVCYITKIFISIFFGKPSPDTMKALEGKNDETVIERFVGFSFIVIIALLGLFSPAMLSKVIVPMAGTFTYSEYYLNYLQKTSVWYIPDLIGIAIALVLGAVIYIYSIKKGLFLYQPPAFLSVEKSVYRPVIDYLYIVYTKIGRLVDNTVNLAFHGAPMMLARASSDTAYLDEQVFNNIGVSIVRSGASGWEFLYRLWITAIDRVFGRIGRFLRQIFMLLFKFDYSAKGDKRFQIYNISNIDFDLFIVLIVIVAILVTSLLFIL